MSHPMRALAALIATAALAFAGTAEARDHHRHHHHVAPAATKRVCRHHHCHTVKVAAAPVSHRVCRHHHCRTVTVAAATTRRVCHHHHCHTVKVAAAHVRGHAVAAARPGDNGTCKSVRIHGQWVQRCNFPGGQ